VIGIIVRGCGWSLYLKIEVKGVSMFQRRFPWGKVAVAFLVGAAAGAATALLLTPVTGKKFQKQLKSVVEDQVDNVEKFMKNVVNA
jgi:YtxH-like protein